MLYIILDKATRAVINDYPSDSPNLKPQEAYAAFDTQTMQLVHTEQPIDTIAPYYDNIDGHCNICDDGLLIEKTLAEKAAANALDFDPEFLTQTEDLNNVEGATQALKVVQLAQQFKLLKTAREL